MFRILNAAVATILLALAGMGLAMAQEPSNSRGDNLMKACGDQWRSVRAAETANGVTWPQFLSRCRADAAATGAGKNDAARTDAARTGAIRTDVPKTDAPKIDAPKTDALRSGAASAAATPAASARAPTSVARAAAAPVFPEEVSSKHSGERPALARQRTCAEQFKVNKASGANGGLRWIEQGGGYWSRCNAHLKQARA